VGLLLQLPLLLVALQQLVPQQQLQLLELLQQPVQPLQLVLQQPLLQLLEQL